MSRYIELHPVNPQARLVAKVVGTLRDGGLVAYPTDSGYAPDCDGPAMGPGPGVGGACPDGPRVGDEVRDRPGEDHDEPCFDDGESDTGRGEDGRGPAAQEQACEVEPHCIA